jgi:hypothetical protein
MAFCTVTLTTRVGEIVFVFAADVDAKAGVLSNTKPAVTSITKHIAKRLNMSLSPFRKNNPFN